MIKGVELHNIIGKIFNGDVRGLYNSEQLQACCPKCQKRDNLPMPDGKYNLEINTKYKVFRCWKCDEPKFAGNLGRLIRSVGNKSDYELYKSYTLLDGLEKLNNNEDVDYLSPDIRIDLPKEFIPFSQMDTNNPKHLEAYNYLVLERLISRDLILKYNMGFCLSGKYWGRIIIPSYNIYGELNYFIGRSYKGHKNPYLNPKTNKSDIIFNEGLVNWDSTIYLVEGVFDMMTVPINTIILLGKTLSKLTYDNIKEKKPNIVILLDPDAINNAIEIFQILMVIYGDEPHKLKILTYDGKSDIDEIRKEMGIEEVKKMLRNIRDLSVDDYFNHFHI